ncbi:KPN_02809 family neutral zinc metallopeptidase [Chondromyces apiculatus]|uniref:YpfJ protein, zinc metalloprotease superfamily n=1 Tax=Chondromyces apiculatus DSM 436 TaxID=1192034 RepID=A0A017TFU2_9BACT|nr:neutral zinc metallopeptidase [Chondromyces apiculatus]EYF07476.1 YpfJ protein, zinc metalloprotease superfamily [Chondromyces apiculatus DSM 436]
MRWDENHESPDVIDRRGEGGGGGPALGGMFAFLPLLMRSRFGWVGLLVIIAVAMFGGLRGLFGGGEQRVHGETRGVAGAQGDEKMVHFVSFVLDDAQTTWRELFSERGRSYRNAKMVLFTGATQTACGRGRAATGPFYCPPDERVYIDLSFYQELSNRLGARGDFAQAYVIAHEIGHHVQHQLGTDKRVQSASRAEQEGAGGASVRLELQADCYAGVWAHATKRRDLLEAGDLDEALNAAAAIGDDRLQRDSGGAVQPETWTHGSSAQRSRWFKRGYESGDPSSCDTFAEGTL